MTTPITDGVFAMHKPGAITSAQVLRDLQDHFIPSKFFAGALAADRAKRDAESHRQQKRRRDKSIRVKLGHGGTLDPLATGILICGVGKGTKDLPSFLGCKKTYETVVLFGAATDTYDSEGKVVARAPYQHITREATEKLIQEKFIGEFKQTPPIWSALKIDGKHAYDYAREGKELPRELAARDMKVDECQILEWYEPGEHTYTWPTEEAPKEEKDIVKQVYDKVAEVETEAAETSTGTKRDSSAIDASSKSEGTEQVEDEPQVKRRRMSNASPPAEQPQQAPGATDSSATAQTEQPASTTSKTGPPAAKIRLTVSSGFYVRSFCHDLGIGLGSLGLMSALVRSRQAKFELANTDNILEYADIEKGEEFWSAKLEGLLKRWPAIRAEMITEKTIDGEDEKSSQKHEARTTQPKRDGKPDWRKDRRDPRPGRQQQYGRDRRDNWDDGHRESSRRSPEYHRQNTSSPEP